MFFPWINFINLNLKFSYCFIRIHHTPVTWSMFPSKQSLRRALNADWEVQSQGSKSEGKGKWGSKNGKQMQGDALLHWLLLNNKPWRDNSWSFGRCTYSPTQDISIWTVLKIVRIVRSKEGEILSIGFRLFCFPLCIIFHMKNNLPFPGCIIRCVFGNLEGSKILPSVVWHLVWIWKLWEESETQGM